MERVKRRKNGQKKIYTIGTTMLFSCSLLAIFSSFRVYEKKKRKKSVDIWDRSLNGPSNLRGDGSW